MATQHSVSFKIVGERYLAPAERLTDALRFADPLQDQHTDDSYQARCATVPTAVSDQLQAKRKARQLVSGLTERKRYIIKHRYGLLGEEAKSLVEVAVLMGISASRVHALELDALKTLRARAVAQRLQALPTCY